MTPTAKNTGGGRPPKRLFLDRGSRLAVSLRSPDAPIHAPTTLRTPASRASVKGRDSADVMEPDGPPNRRFVCGPATATEQPAQHPRPLLPPTTPWCRPGSPALAPHGRSTTRAAACRRLPPPRRRARPRKRREPCTGIKKKNQSMAPNRPRAPPSGLARQPRRVHTKSTAPTTPAATDSASSGDAVLKW